MKQGRTEKIILEIGELLDDARGVSAALNIAEGLSRIERLNRDQALRSVFDLINVATVHLVRQEAQSYGPADKASVLVEIEGLKERVLRISDEQVPPAIKDLAERTLGLVDTIVGKATSASMAVAVAAMEKTGKSVAA